MGTLVANLLNLGKHPKRPWNPWPGSVYETSTSEQIDRFASVVMEGNVPCTVRRPRGQGKVYLQKVVDWVGPTFRSPFYFLQISWLLADSWRALMTVNADQVTRKFLLGDLRLVRHPLSYSFICKITHPFHAYSHSIAHTLKIVIYSCGERPVVVNTAQQAKIEISPLHFAQWMD